MKAILLGFLLAFSALSITPSSLHEPQVSTLAPSAGFTLTAASVNVTVDASAIANATILVHGTSVAVTVGLILTQVNEDLTCTGPSPSVVNVPPDANATFSCSSTATNTYPITVVGKNPSQPTLTDSVLVNLIFTSSASSHGPESAAGLPSFEGPIPLVYLAVGGVVVAIAAVAGFATILIRKKRAPMA